MRKMASSVKFAPVTMETHGTHRHDRAIGSARSLGSVRLKFLHNPGVPLSTDEDERLRVQVETKAKTKRKKSEKPRPRSESMDPFETEDKETRRLRELRERRLAVIDDLIKLRNHYYAVYRNKLSDKVAEQRKEIQRRTDELNRRIQRKELKAKRDAHKVKKRHKKSPLNHDNVFLENLPRTKLHQIVCLEEKLMREGRFRTSEDLEKFWSDVEDSDILRQMLGDGKTQADINENLGSSHEDVFSDPSLGNSLTSSQASLNHEDQPTDSFVRGLSQIHEDSESSRPGTKSGLGSHSWAVTQQYKKMENKSQQRAASGSSHKERNMDHVMHLGQVEFPELSCFTLDLEPQPVEDPEIVRMREEYRLKARLRDAGKRRVHKMYETSLTHQAATQRILSKKSEFLDLIKGPNLADVVQVSASEVSSDCNSNDCAENLGLNEPFLALAMTEEDSVEIYKYGQDPDHTGVVESEGGASGRSSAHTRGTQSRMRESFLPSLSIGKNSRLDKRAPLTMDSILSDCTTKEAKGLSSLWVNYSKHLPSVI